MKLQERLDSRHQQGEEIKKRYLTFRIEHQLFGIVADMGANRIAYLSIRWIFSG